MAKPPHALAFRNGRHYRRHILLLETRTVSVLQITSISVVTIKPLHAQSNSKGGCSGVLSACAHPTEDVGALGGWPNLESKRCGLHALFIHSKSAKEQNITNIWAWEVRPNLPIFPCPHSMSGSVFVSTCLSNEVAIAQLHWLSI